LELPAALLSGDPPSGNQKRFFARNGFGWISNKFPQRAYMDVARITLWSGRHFESPYTRILSVFAASGCFIF
jgi:hypothetical protein